EFAVARTPNQENLVPRIGRDFIASSVRKNVGPTLTVHKVCMAEIDVLSGDAAVGKWAMSDLIEGVDRPVRWPDIPPLQRFTADGHSHETYARLGGQWQSSKLTLTRMRTVFQR